MWLGALIGCAFLALCSAPPPAHINRLALFPDKSAWCEAKNITQIVGHTGCQSRSIENRSVQPEETHCQRPRNTSAVVPKAVPYRWLHRLTILKQMSCTFMLEHMTKIARMITCSRQL